MRKQLLRTKINGVNVLHVRTQKLSKNIPKRILNVRLFLLLFIIIIKLIFFSIIYFLIIYA